MRQSAVIQASASGFQNRGYKNRVVHSRETAAKIGRRCQPRADLNRGVDKRFDAAIPIARLAGKVSLCIGRVLHEQRVWRGKSGTIGGERVTAVGLVNLHFAFLAEVIKPLL